MDNPIESSKNVVIVGGGGHVGLGGHGGLHLGSP